MGEEQEERQTDPAPQAEGEEAVASRPSETDWQALAEERWDTILRLRADFENYRRRIDREREDLRVLVAGDILVRFLSVYDNLDRALKAMPDGEDTRAVRTGLEMTRRSFLELLRQEGVELVPTVGTTFDPAVHEAIGRVTHDTPDGTVLDEVQAGFRSKSRVLRAALVRVSAGPETEVETGTDNDADGAVGEEEKQGGSGGGPA